MTDDLILPTELDTEARGDPYLRNLARVMRDGKGMSLEAAVDDQLLTAADPARVRAAAAWIQDYMLRVQTAREPRAVVAGGIETWYLGPRAEDDCWPRLVEILRDEGWTDEALRALDDSSTKVVAHLPNPNGRETSRSRGLVLGYVQSGKTTNFIAVIAKAADAGYRLFIVLSGVHDALRLQTQERLNHQLWDPNRDIWHRLTNEEDFRPTDNVDALLTATTKRTFIVVKKNGARLRGLRRWLSEARPEHLRDCPVLVIDDEADQASVNTAKQGRRTAINRLVVEIAREAPRSAYIGYTATPFANVLIDPTDEDDLYPRDFIVDLPRPDFYIGPEAIFGREPLEFDADDSEDDDGFDFVRSVHVDELDDLRPRSAAAAADFDPSVTPSLDAALRYFLLSTAARRSRGRGNRHATALVHTSQRVAAHDAVATVVNGHLRGLAKSIASGDPRLLAELEAQWRKETARVRPEDFTLDPVSWKSVASELAAVAEDAEVIVDNSRSLQRLDFNNENPRVIVAIGGNTLSRGLTLEGLAVSYFVRTASAYDTLLQMGRWFGYRNGYADLMRIWMTDEMRAWFHHLATVEQEIRYDIERYEAEHISPKELGVRIRTHPKLAITAAAKMQHARPARASYSGRRIQTILFNHRDHDWLRANIDAATRLLDDVSQAPHRRHRDGITIIGPFRSAAILSFLRAYRFHENSRDLNGKLITQYIEARINDHELEDFTIAVMGRSSTDGSLGSVDLGSIGHVGCINRSRLDVIGGSTYADIKSVMSQSDRVIDLGISGVEYQKLASESADTVSLLRNTPDEGGRGDGSGLLLLYPISKDSTPMRSRTRVALHAVEHVIGVGLVFPKSFSRDAGIEYVTVDVSELGVDVEEPDDLPEDPDEPIGDS